MKFVAAVSLLILVACSEVKDDHYALITQSIISDETVIVARFNGNSGTKQQDCEVISKLLEERNGNKYSCIKLKDLKI